MKFFRLMAAAGVFAVAASPAFASDWGIDVQVNEGAPLPALNVLQAVAPGGSTVRDLLGWSKVEHSRGLYRIPAANWALYQRVAAAGDKNVVTLFAGNPIYGTATFGFPTTPEQIRAWANYAAYVVSNDGGTAPDSKAANIPNLEAVTIWNEFNGTWNGGIQDPRQQQAAMAQLLTVVVPAIRAANPNVKIAAGAYIGAPNLATWFKGIGDSFDWHLVDWLDVHPYVANAVGATDWQHEVSMLRAAGIDNPFYFSEWGGGAAVNYAAQTPGNMAYPLWFIDHVIAVDPVAPAGGNYFTLSDAKEWPLQGLTTGKMTVPADQLTTTGGQYMQYFLPWAAAQTVASE